MLHPMDLRRLQAGRRRRDGQDRPGLPGRRTALSSNSGGFNPWSPALLAEFQKRKSYDLRPYLGVISAIILEAAARRPEPSASTRPTASTPTFCDVWSDLYGENFFGLEGQWCAANQVEMQTHVEHEENLPGVAGFEAISSNACAASRCPALTPSAPNLARCPPPISPSSPRRRPTSTAIPGRCARPSPLTIPPPTSRRPAGFSIIFLVNGINRIEYMGLAERVRAAAFTASRLPRRLRPRQPHVLSCWRRPAYGESDIMSSSASGFKRLSRRPAFAQHEARAVDVVGDGGEAGLAVKAAARTPLRPAPYIQLRLIAVDEEMIENPGRPP